MPALARGQASDCTNPELDLFTLVNGVKTNMDTVEFQVFEKVTDPDNPIQVFPPSGRYTVDAANDCPTGDRVSTGRYVAQYTPDLAELIGTHEIRWYFKPTPTSAEVTFQEEFEVLAEATGSSGVGYCTVQELRDEGVPSTGSGAVSDSKLQTIITRASVYVDQYTGRWFEPRTLTLDFDGSGAASMLLEQPIISITSVAIDSVALSLADVLVYNRHITQNLLAPDDRENPRIEIDQPLHDDLLYKVGLKHFPRGQQNIRIVGMFGYTDYDGTSTGKTPDLICEATKLIVMRELTPKYGAAGNDPVFSSANIVEEKTRDQSVKFANPTNLGAQSPGPFFGDRRIDSILMRYRLPPRVRSV